MKRVVSRVPLTFMCIAKLTRTRRWRALERKKRTRVWEPFSRWKIALRLLTRVVTPVNFSRRLSVSRVETNFPAQRG